MHLQDAAHTLLAVLHGVVDSGTCLNLTGVYTEVCQLTNERVGSNLEGQSCEGSCLLYTSWISLAVIQFY